MTIFLLLMSYPGQDPMEAALRTCQTEARPGETLIYLSKPEARPALLSADQERHKINLEKLAAAGFVTCTWAEGESLEDAVARLFNPRSEVTTGAGTAARRDSFAFHEHDNTHPLGEGFEWTNS